jgi:hypothetical protein
VAFEGWSDDEFRMFDELVPNDEAFNDQFLQLAYDYALFSPDQDYVTRVAMRDYLIDRLRDEYGVDFETAFDWNDYRNSGESDA